MGGWLVYLPRGTVWTWSFWMSSTVPIRRPPSEAKARQSGKRGEWKGVMRVTWGGWVGGWVEEVEEEERQRIRCCGLLGGGGKGEKGKRVVDRGLFWVSGWVGG